MARSVNNFLNHNDFDSSKVRSSTIIASLLWLASNNSTFLNFVPATNEILDSFWKYFGDSPNFLKDGLKQNFYNSLNHIISDWLLGQSKNVTIVDFEREHYLRKTLKTKQSQI